MRLAAAMLMGHCSTGDHQTGLPVSIFTVTSPAGTCNNTELQSIPRAQLASASTGDYIIFAGGTRPWSPYDPLDAVDIFNAATGTWTSGPQMPRRRTDFAAAALGLLVYVFGGRTDVSVTPTTVTNEVDVYDILARNWTTVAPQMPASVYALAAASTGNAAMYAGGMYVASLITCFSHPLLSTASYMYENATGILVAVWKSTTWSYSIRIRTAYT